MIYKMEKRNPTLSTVEMIRNTIREHDRAYTPYQLWKQLPKKIMYPTFKKAIILLQEQGEILIDEHGKIVFIERNLPKLQPTERETILYNLAHYGYALITLREMRDHTILSIEDLFMQILLRFPEGRFINAIPMLMLKNRIDPFTLYWKAKYYGLINQIGFLLDITYRIAKKTHKNISYLFPLLKECREQKTGKEGYLGLIRDEAFVRQTTPSLLKKWNLLGRFTFESFYNEAYL